MRPLFTQFLLAFTLLATLAVYISLFRFDRYLDSLDGWASLVTSQIAIVLFALGINLFILTRWYKEQSRRLSLIRTAAHHFQLTRRVKDVKPLLAEFESRVQNLDEVEAVGKTMLEMMQQIESSFEKEQGFLETLSMLEEAIICLNSDDRIIDASPGWDKLMAGAGTNHNSFLSFIHPNERTLWIQNKKKLLLKDVENIVVRLRLDTQESLEVWIEGRFFKSIDSVTQDAKIRGIIRNVTSEYEQEQKIKHLALYDGLTGLANRTLLEERVKQALSMSQRTGSSFAVAFFDLDHFKHINDSLGHHVGDSLLVELSRIIKQTIRETDTLARWGGDEFVILFNDIDKLMVQRILDNLMDEFSDPISVDGKELPVRFSIGTSMYPLDADNVASLFVNADKAMFYAKNQGRNQYQFYSDMSDDSNVLKDIDIKNKLMYAVNSNQVFVVYQPIINSKTQKVFAVEALARWEDKDYGSVPPDIFIGVAERSGMISQLGQQIMNYALQDLSSWRKQGVMIPMFINISSRQLFLADFVPKLLETLSTLDLSPQDVVFEVTESMAVRDVDHAMDSLFKLHQLGFRVSIDDFGAGQSSLSQLQDVKVDNLKIDKRFISNLMETKGNSMVLAVANMARALNLKTVAEGVESAEQAEELCNMGVDYLQGYWFAKPMSANDCICWIQSFDLKK